MNPLNNKYVLRVWTIVSCNPETQVFRVAPLNDTDPYAPTNSAGIEAQFISPEPFDQDYSGRFEHIPRGTMVLVALELSESGIDNAYILGYASLLNSIGTHGQYFKQSELEVGERRDVGPTGMIFERKRNGIFRWFFGPFLSFKVNKVSQILSALVNGIDIFFRTGRFLWSWSPSTRKTLFDFFITRDELPANNYIDKEFGAENPPVNTDSYHDRLRVKLMDNTDEAGRVLIAETRQAKRGEKTGSVFTRTKIGKNDETQAVISSEIWDDEKKITVDMMGEDAFNANINDGKIVITMSYDGAITLKIADDTAKILMGGSGVEQQLLTKSYHDKYIAQHIHLNGNNGAPTGKPMLPILPAAPIRSATNWHTQTTQAE